MQQDPLMSVGEAQNATDLRPGEPLEVTQDEHFTLAGGKGVYRVR